MARAFLICAVVTGCGHVRASTPPEPATPAPRVEQTIATEATTGAQVERYLADSGLNYLTLEADRRWMIAFAGDRVPRIVVFVVYADAFTVVLGRLFTVGDDAGDDFYRKLARKNFEHDQLKLSVDDRGGVYASYEVPTRLLDRRELLENVFGLASAIDALVPALNEHAVPESLEPEELPLNKRPILEVRRSVR